MTLRNLVAVKCKLSQGLFSSERAFEIVLANREMHSGPVPLHYCWNAEKKPLLDSEATSHEIDGYIAARIVDDLGADQVAVEVPDGEVLAVRRDQTAARPTPILPAAATTA